MCACIAALSADFDSCAPCCVGESLIDLVSPGSDKSPEKLYYQTNEGRITLKAHEVSGLKAGWARGEHLDCYMSIIAKKGGVIAMTTGQSWVAREATQGKAWKSGSTSGMAVWAVSATMPQGIHWFVLGAVPQDRVLVYYDSMSPRTASPPVSVKHMGWLERLRQRDPEGMKGAELWPWWQHPQALPGQEAGDSVNCGIFAVLFVQCFVLGSPHTYSTAQMPQLRQQMIKGMSAQRAADRKLVATMIVG